MADDGLKKRVVWPFDEGSGGTVAGDEQDGSHLGINQDESVVIDWDLTAGFHDPSAFGFDLLYGAVPTSGADLSYTWEKRTVFRPRIPVTPVYRPIGGP